MTREQLGHFRHKLEAQRALVNERIAAAGARAREPVEGAIGESGDDPVRDVLVDTTLEVGELRTRELEEIEDALLRIELGEYGICEECGQSIELARLEAVPYARLCETDARRRTDHTKRPTL
jgi:DnaK suppressor protein